VLKNITLSAEDAEIQLAREKARRAGTTLNETFRKWLSDYARAEVSASNFQCSVEDMRLATLGQPARKFTREEMNERR
jgi:hypothetical protein